MDNEVFVTPSRARILRRLVLLALLVFFGGLLACTQAPALQCKSADDCQQGKRCLEGVCDCPAPLRLCGDKCVDIRSDNNHCGACDTDKASTDCSAGKSCRQGRCQCPTGQRECPGAEGACIDITSDARHCGGCGSTCADGQLCAKSACVSKCPDATPTVCGSSCINTKSDDLHCGKCDTKCTKGTTCVSGKCACTAGQRACQSNGVTTCVDPLTDKLNCGKCSNACTASQLCAAGTCLDECPSTTPTICFGGCIDPDSNIEHCGKCGNKCTGSKRCVQGVCNCVQDKISCQDTCVNTRYTRDHCGKCGNKCSDGLVCGDGRCLTSCPRATEKVCFGGCVNLSNNTDHCGKCGTACLPGQTCTDGKCECPTGQVFCDGQCVDPQSHPLHCGACGSACKGAELCGGGKCVTTCPTVTPTNCARACVELKDNPLHCGACGKQCLPGQRCTNGNCGCDKTQLACNGQCIDPQTSNSNCGTCGNKCGPGTECKEGKCTLVCAAEEAICSNACVNNQTDNAHCGECNKACQGRKRCTDGKCLCPGQLKDCDGACLNTTTNNKHCGACGNACNVGERCTDGKCTLACPAGQAICNGQCVDHDTDNRHCGKCDTPCDGTQVCTAGICTCPTGQSACQTSGGSGTSCVYTSFDKEHCGACGNKCGTGEYCISGKCEKCSTNTAPCGTSCCGQGTFCCNNTCVIATSPLSCGATAANKCGTNCSSSQSCCQQLTTLTCADTQTDTNNCGSCGLRCKAGDVCCGGKCLASFQSDPANCGACGNACKTNESCCAGKCTNTNTTSACGSCSTSCNSGESCCSAGANTTCADTQSDVKHCGTCGNTCKTNESCCAGKCVNTQTNPLTCGSCNTQCNATNKDCCGGSCTNTQSNTTHCGTCNNKCAANTSCCAGGCKNLQSDTTACGACTNQCLPGSSCCSGTCADFTRDRINCGKCGTICTGADICFNSKCRCVPYFYETCGNNQDDDCDGIKDNPAYCTGLKPPTNSIFDYGMLDNEGIFAITKTSPMEGTCYNANGSVRKATFTISTMPTTHFANAYAVIKHRKAKRVVVLWMRLSRVSRNPGDLYYRVYDDACNPITPTRAFNNLDQDYFRWFNAAMDGNGNFAIIFRTTSTVPVVRFFNALGTQFKQLNADGPTRRCSSRNSTMRIAMNVFGAGLISCHSTSDAVPIYYRRFDKSRNFIDPDFVALADSASGNAGRGHSHNIAINDLGQFVIQWQNRKAGTNQAVFFNNAGAKLKLVTLSNAVETGTGGFSSTGEALTLIGTDFVLRDTIADSRRVKHWYRYNPTGTLRSAAGREYNFDPRYTRGDGANTFVLNGSLGSLIQKLDLGIGKGLCSGQACLCTPGSTILCANFNFGSKLRNQCHYGTRTCNPTGTAYSKCTDFGLPIAEVCGNKQDDDCDGRVDDNCNVPNTQVFPDNPSNYDVTANGTKMWVKPSGYTLLGYCINPNGTPLRQPWVISTQSFSGSPTVSAAKASGRFYVTWIDRSAPSHTLWTRKLQIFDKTCKEVGTPITLEPYTDYTSYSDIAVDDNGNIAHTYLDAARDTYIRFFNNVGTPRGAAIKIDSRSKCIYRPRLAMNSTTGDSIVVCNDSNTGVYYQRFRANGTARDAALVLVAGSDGGKSSSGFISTVGMNRKGAFVIAWLHSAARQFKANFYNASATLVKTVTYSTTGQNFNSIANYQEYVVLLGDDFVLRDGENSNTPTYYRYTPAGVLKSKFTQTNSRINRGLLRSDDTGKHYMPDGELLRINPLTLP